MEYKGQVTEKDENNWTICKNWNRRKDGQWKGGKDKWAALETHDLIKLIQRRMFFQPKASRTDILTKNPGDS